MFRIKKKYIVFIKRKGILFAKRLGKKEWWNLEFFKIAKERLITVWP